MALAAELERLKEFHGHLGPYAVVGLRMGRAAVEKLGKESLKCVVRTGLVKPLSCIIDGIQLASSCTLGKGKIFVENDGIAEAEFYKNNLKIKIKLKDDIKKEIDKKMCKETEKELALWVYKMDVQELFCFTSL